MIKMDSTSDSYHSKWSPIWFNKASDSLPPFGLYIDFWLLYRSCSASLLESSSLGWTGYLLLPFLLLPFFISLLFSSSHVLPLLNCWGLPFYRLLWSGLVSFSTYPWCVIQYIAYSSDTTYVAKRITLGDRCILHMAIRSKGFVLINTRLLLQFSPSILGYSISVLILSFFMSF